MGDPTCLLRSFSHPSSACRESKEGDPFRALTESISFGRFMSESLAWEKWSAFSHNRYLEEVEQFSKPGSVAQKKAFFEAHYKKRAAMKAAALLEQQNATVNSFPDQEMAANNLPETETATAVKSTPEEEMADDRIPETEHMDKTCRHSLSAEATSDVIDRQEENQVLEPTYSCDANNLDSEKDCLQDAKWERAEEPMQEKEQTGNFIQVEHSKRLDTVQNYDKVLAAPEKKSRNKEVTEKENVVLQKNNAALPINKRQMYSSSKSSSQSRASKIPKSNTKMVSSTQPNGGPNFKPKSKSSTVDLISDKKQTPKSVRTPINFASHSGITNKASIRMSKECSPSTINSARASIHGISKFLPSANCQSDDKRNQACLNKSVSGGTLTGGILQALSGDCTKSSVSKARSPIMSSPFSFRSEERAAKRKEFFQKLEEKNNLKTQVKYKVPSTHPRSPKLGRRPSSSVAAETVIQLSRRPSVNAESSKQIIPKSKQSTAHSVTSLPRKNVHENASPNIRL